ncbi:retinol dehydrogenase 12 isoform X2 [Tribolium castaneum]
MADVANLEKSKNDVIKHTNNSNIIAKKLDLGSLESIREFANEIKRNETRLDILVNNAGIGSCSSATIDGLNAVMQVNYFGHFLLTHLLIDLLKKSSPARIIFTSSILSFFNNLTVGNLNPGLDTPQSFRNQLQIYNNSKFALTVASGIFAKKLQTAAVTSNCVHPGLVSTYINLSLLDETNIFVKIVVKLLFFMFAKDSWTGSQSIVHVAVSQKLEHVTGGFFVDCLQFWAPGGREDEFEEIWRASEEFVKLGPEEKLS